MNLSPLELVVLILAAYRVTRFLTTDTILGRLPDGVEYGTGYRGWLDRWAWDEAGADRTFLRGKIGELLTCPWCIGWWVSGALYLSFEAASGRFHDVPLYVHGIVWWGVAGAQAILSARVE